MQRILIVLIFAWPFMSKGQSITSFFQDGVLVEKKIYNDTLSFTKSISSRQLNWINKGYFFSGLDSIVNHENQTKVFFHLGEKLQIDLVGVKKRNFLNQIHKKLQTLNNNGYPFASIYLDSLVLKEGTFRGVVSTRKGPEIRYDSAHFFQDLKTKHEYIYRLLDIVPGEAFSESSYFSLKKKVNRSSFLSLERPTDISFSKGKAKIYLDVEEKVNSTFEGVAGLQQQGDGKTSLVGSLDLSIQNLFRSGHEFNFYWESFAEESQQLNLFYKHAFLFDAKISPSFRFSLLKQDTTFLTRMTGIGVSTFISPQISLLLEYENTNGSLISPNAEEVEGRGLADYQRNFYRLALSSGYFMLLSEYGKGVAWNVSIGAGVKDITRNAGLPSNFYDTVDVKTNFLRMDSRVAYQLKMGKRQTFFHEVQLGLMDNDEILTNELYRIGGFNTLRGFNEKNFFAQYFGLSRLEMRSFFENRSFIYVFYDQLLLQRSNANETPLGIGFGFALETSAGQFSFALAGGRSTNQTISFSELRAHFGYVSRF